MILYTDTYDSNKNISLKDGYILAKGGDGTLLKAITKYKSKNLPFFGLAAGTVNFLMNEDLEPNKDAKYKKFNLIKVNVSYIEDNTIKTGTHWAFNDIVIGEFNSWISFTCSHKDDILGRFNGSGIIVSTAQGSTGINKNNNGTILPLSSKDWSITGMQCNRNINYVLESRKLYIEVESRDSVTLCIDGKNRVIHNVKDITLSKGDNVIVIFNDYSKFKRKRQ